jgi:hypothetical protein
MIEYVEELEFKEYIDNKKIPTAMKKHLEFEE